MKLIRRAIQMIPSIIMASSIQVMAGALQTINFPEIADQVTSSGPITLTAVSESGLAVSFAIVSSGDVATLAGDTLSFTGNPGSVTVKASQAGNGTFDPAKDVFRSFSVGDSSLRFVSVASGASAYHTIGIRADGSLWTWGQGGDGRKIPVRVGTESNWASGACGYGYSVAIRRDGTLWAWGGNDYGQLGHGNTSGTAVPKKVGTASNWVSVACGFAHTLALQADGTLWAWGLNVDGQLGDGTTTSRNAPVQIGSATDWASVACGDTTTAAIRADGRLWTWGDNFLGQLGDGTNQDRSSPTAISTMAWKQIACGRSHMVALRNDGTLWSWGPNNVGQLGIGSDVGSRIPVQIADSTDWITVACGGRHTVALRSNGAAMAWGANESGQIGDGSSIARLSPVLVRNSVGWASVVCGNDHTVGLTNVGVLKAWGGSSFGQLGIGTSANRPCPVPSENGVPWKSVDFGNDHAAAVRVDGALWTWGKNAFGNLGDGSRNHRPLPFRVGTDANWTEVACSVYHTVGLRDDGTLWSWGGNGAGQLGQGNKIDQVFPVRIGNYSNWKSIACGYGHSAALRNDGTLWTWGVNDWGQVGDGSTTDRLAPVQVGSEDGWVAVSCGSWHTVAVRDDGTLWSWGYNGDGQLGTGSITDQLTPVQVGSRTDWSKVACGGKHTVALCSDGTLWAWGNNGSGQLGDGSQSRRTTPVQIGVDADWDSISCGGDHTLALRNNGTLWSWGNNASSQLGDGTTTRRVAPGQVGGGSAWAALPESLGSGRNRSAVLALDGSLWTWGSGETFTEGVMALGRFESRAPLKIWPEGAEQILTWPTPPMIDEGESITLVASPDSGLPATYSVSGPATLRGERLTGKGPGMISVVAFQAGDRSWFPSAFMIHTLAANPAPEVSVSGNNREIANGDITPSVDDHTDFGQSGIASGILNREYTITNSGSLVLDLTGTPLVSVAGSSAFTVSEQPLKASLDGGGDSVGFTVAFAPSIAGSHRASVTIVSNDRDENSHTFEISGFCEVASKEVLFTDGVATLEEQILPGGRLVYTFNLDTPCSASFFSVGGEGLHTKLLDSSGKVVASSVEDGDFAFEELLLAGQYSLELVRANDHGPVHGFSLNFDVSDLAEIQPDVEVGTSRLGMTGAGIYTPVSQLVMLTSPKLVPITAQARISNRDFLPGTFSVTAGNGSTLFKVRWFGGNGNATSSLTTGTYVTALLAAGEDEWIQVQVTPNRKKLRKKRGRKVVIVRASLTLTIEASTMEGPSKADAAAIRFNTK